MSSTDCWRTVCTSTTGASPVTVIVSSTEPTAICASTVAVNPAPMVMPSRTTVEKPGSVNVTT